MYTYYALPLHDFTKAEINDGDAGEVATFELDVPTYPDGDANEPQSGTVTVKVVAPKGYELTNTDHANIGELVA